MIGKPLRKIDAMAKCAGETIYADDLNLPRMIYGKLLRSPHPHARILRISTARALKLDGVFAVITGEEMPEKFGIMPSTQDEEALVIDKARYAGDPVAAVAAETESLAEQALGLIDVEYEVLKPISPSKTRWYRPRRASGFTPGTAKPTFKKPCRLNSVTSKKPSRNRITFSPTLIFTRAILICR